VSHSIKREEDSEVGIGKDVQRSSCNQFKNIIAQICLQKWNLLRKECIDFGHL